MQYTTNESLQQVLERSERVRRKRERRRLTVYSLSVCAILLTLTLALSSAPLALPDGDAGSALGSFLLKPETGGIIAAIVLAFALGILVTLFCIRQKRTNNERSPGNSHNEDEGGRKQ